jgi:hypothetical protein
VTTVRWVTIAIPLRRFSLTIRVALPRNHPVPRCRGNLLGGGAVDIGRFLRMQGAQCVAPLLKLGNPRRQCWVDSVPRPKQQPFSSNLPVYSLLTSGASFGILSGYFRRVGLGWAARAKSFAFRSLPLTQAGRIANIEGSWRMWFAGFPKRSLTSDVSWK